MKKWLQVSIITATDKRWEAERIFRFDIWRASALDAMIKERRALAIRDIRSGWRTYKLEVLGSPARFASDYVTKNIAFVARTLRNRREQDNISYQSEL